MISKSPISLKLCAIIFAGILGLQAAWLLTPGLIISPTPFFPTNKDEVEYVTAHRDAAAAAARIGWPRGDLWVDYAIAAAAELLNNTGAHMANDGMKLITTRAAALAPYDSRAWLLLAAIDARLNSTGDKTLAPLKMSYYTSPNDIRLIPLRLQVATRIPKSPDEELKGLVGHEIRTIILYRPDLKQTMVDAYREALPGGRRLIEESVTKIDPGFLTELRAKGR